MIVSNGGGLITDSIEVDYADEIPNIIIDNTNRITAGGQIKTIVSGERFSLGVRVRVSQLQYRILINLLRSSQGTLYYTPEQDYSIMYPTVAFPLMVSITDIKQEFKGGVVQYISFTVTGTEYIL